MTGLQSHAHHDVPAVGRIKIGEEELFRLRDDESLFRVMMRTAWVGFLGAMANGLESMRERAINGRDSGHWDD